MSEPHQRTIDPGSQRSMGPGGEPGIGWVRGQAAGYPASGAAPEVVAARAYLCRVAEPPAPALAAFVAQHGPVEAAARVRREAVPPPVAVETGARRHLEHGDADLVAAAAVGARLLVPEDDAWPAWPFAAFTSQLAAIEEDMVAPLALWVRGPGRLDDLAERSVAVVGSRAATGYGEHVASEFAAGLADRDATVVSGAAYGIDGAAHRGALAVGGATIAVLACGVDRAYPAGHERLLQRIASSGLVVSEYPPGAAPARHRFLVRNRLIAALSGGTLVVEAAARSGARRTASVAAALGRPVMVVPGPVTSPMSVGCHRMVREAAASLVTRVEEVLEEVGRIGADLADPLPTALRPTDGLDPKVLRVHEALPARAVRSASRLSVEAGVDLPNVLAALPRLELAGLVERRDGGWCRAGARGGGGGGRSR